MSEESYIWGTSKRKCAIAQIRLLSKEGGIVINGKLYQEVFARPEHRHMIEHPFLTTDTMGKFQTIIKVKGGGVSGQAGAIRHGIARALANM